MFYHLAVCPASIVTVCPVMAVRSSVMATNVAAISSGVVVLFSVGVW